MSEERKVVCPWCGWEMEHHEGTDGFQDKYIWFECPQCGARGPVMNEDNVSEALPAAYLAATRRPPAVESTELDGMITHCEEVIGGMCDTNPCRADHVKLRAALVELKATRDATRRALNLPLTREQVEAMDDLDAAWCLDEETGGISLFRADRAKKYRVHWIGNGMCLFASRPTPADIDAARKAGANE